MFELYAEQPYHTSSGESLDDLQPSHDSVNKQFESRRWVDKSHATSRSCDILCGAYFDTILVGVISTLAHECIKLCKQSQICGAA